jgi:pyridoxine 4-dehydrogenase
MPVQRFPLAAFSVARIGFGGIQLPGRGAFGPPRDHAEALAVLRRAVDVGGDHIDTAGFYGPNVINELIREALYPYPDNLALVSKVGARRDDAGGWLPLVDPADFRRDIEANLRTLGVDRLAVVNLRLVDSDRPDKRFDDLLSVMTAARDEGLIGGVGLSNITREHLLHALQQTEISCVQNTFSLVDRSSAPVLQECVARAASPLCPSIP